MITKVLSILIVSSVTFVYVLETNLDYKYQKTNKFGTFEITGEQFMVNWNEDDGNGYDYLDYYYSVVELKKTGKCSFV